MPWASPASLDRVIACPASAVLPRTKSPPGPSAIWGKEVHAAKEGKEQTKRVAKWLALQPPDVLAKTWPGGTHEVMYLEHEGKVTRLSGWPEDKADQWDMFFILDWINTHDAPVPWIDDLKTGRYLPESDTQLKAYNWAFFQDEPWAQHVLSTFTHWPRYPKGAGPVRPPGKVYERSEIVDWYGTTVIPAKRLAQGPRALQDTRPGPWCQWCPCKPNCPEYANGNDPNL